MQKFEFESNKISLHPKLQYQNNSFLTLIFIFSNSFAKDSPIPPLPQVIRAKPSPYFDFRSLLCKRKCLKIKFNNLNMFLIIIIIPII